MTTETTAPKQRGRPFKKGQSGNPQGRPPGVRNAATVLAEQLLDDEAPMLIRKAIQKAKEGNIPALRMCLERVVPPRRDRPVFVRLPLLSTAGDAAAAMATIVKAVAAGSLTPSEAANLSALVDHFKDALIASEFETRLAAIEKQRGSHA